jgi:hypothetical protein
MACRCIQYAYQTRVGDIPDTDEFGKLSSLPVNVPDQDTREQATCFTQSRGCNRLVFGVFLYKVEELGYFRARGWRTQGHALRYGSAVVASEAVLFTIPSLEHIVYSKPEDISKRTTRAFIRPNQRNLPGFMLLYVLV